MDPKEYERMASFEDRHWWFLGRRYLVDRLLQDSLRNTSTGSSPGCILDVGCGTGAMLRQLSGRWFAMGLDLSDLALANCRSKGNAILLRSAADQIGLKDNSCRAVVAMDLLEHMEDDTKALREMERVCKLGGVIILTVPAHQWLWSDHDVALHHKRRYSPASLRAVIQETGLVVEKMSYAMCLLYPAVVLARSRECRRGGGRPPQTSLSWVPSPLNTLLAWLLMLEGELIRFMRLPFGISLVYVLRKLDVSKTVRESGS